MLIIARAYFFNIFRITFRKSCLNPTLGSVFQIIESIKQNNYVLIAYCLPIIIGPFLGVYLASIVFEKVYKPLCDEIKMIK